MPQRGPLAASLMSLAILKRLDHRGKRLRFGEEGLMQRALGRFEPLLDLADRGDVHRGGKTIVRGLSEIDTILWMHRMFCAPRGRVCHSPDWR